MKTADEDTVFQALNIVELAMGLELSDDRRTAIVIAIQSNSYTRAQVMLAARDLCSDTELDEKLRYGGAFTAADFKRMIESDDSNASLGKLYTRAEAVNYWERIGKPGCFARAEQRPRTMKDHITGEEFSVKEDFERGRKAPCFERVEVDDTTKWRLK